MTTSDKGREFIESFEGLRLTAYLDSVGVPTIGYGHTNEVHLGMTCTPEQADAWLAEDLRVAELAVECSVRVPLNQNQFDALVSFTFNVGSGNFEHSTLLRLLNCGQYISAAAQFPVWDRAGGQVLPGLLKRRLAERDLFLEAE